MWLMVLGILGGCSNSTAREPGLSSSTEGQTDSAGGSGSTSESSNDTEASSESEDSTSGSSTGPEPDTTGGVDDPGDPWEPLPAFPELDEETRAGLAAIIDGLLADPAVAAATQGVLIVDLETSQVLYERAPDTVLVPASNAKMFTTAALVDVLGEDHRLSVTVHAPAVPDGAGVVAGDLFVAGEHDFTWSTFFYAAPSFVPERIADRLWNAGVRSITGDLILGGEYLWEGYTLGSYDPAGERAQAATELHDALLAGGIEIGGVAATSGSFEPPGGSVELVRWESVPVGQGNVHINGPSHNEFADIALRHLGWEQAGVSDYLAGGGAMRDWMASIPTDTTAVIWNDGSGLSHGNRVSPRNLVDLLEFMTSVPHGVGWGRTLAISGVRGTISGRMTGADTWGRVFAKTGTLPSIGVVTLSGYLFHRHDGRRYAFSILFNGVGSVSSARNIQDLVLGALATDLRELGERPAAPVLQVVRDEPGDDVLALRWDPVAGVDGYAIWLSPDGRVFEPEHARYVDQTEYRAGQLPFGPDVHVQVTSVRETENGPVHSMPSDVYSGRNTEEGSSILLVDGNDRWQAEPMPENPRGMGHDFVTVHARTLSEAAAELGYDTAAHGAVVMGEVDLDDYELVVWVLGEESDVDRTFDDAEQLVVAEYLGGGGRLMVSGAEIGWDLVELGTPADAEFFTSVLGAFYEGDDAGTSLAEADPQGPWLDAPAVGFYTPRDQVVNYPDRLAPAPGAETGLRYWGGAQGAAVIVGTQVVLFGFPFESIDDPTGRAALMDLAVQHLLP